jgi:acetyltransferase-like isoleucine patch superfamily enzyme
MNQFTTPAGAGIPEFASFGPGSSVVEPYLITCADRIHIGSDVQIAAGSWLSVVDEHLGRRYDPHLLIGDGASLGPDIVIACIGRVEIGARVLTGSRVFIGDTYHDYRDPEAAVIDQPMADPEPVYIGEGAFLGIGSIVLPGVTVGERAYVAAGAVVTAHVPKSTVVAGNPARIIKRWDETLQRWVRADASADRGETGAPLHSEAGAQHGHLEHRAAVTEADLRASKHEVRELMFRRDPLVELLEEAQRGRAAAEFWLEDHRQSLSWRLTAPLRAAKRMRPGTAREVGR